VARARCETQREAELSACRAQQKENNAACGGRQHKQVLQCVSAEAASKIPQLCDPLKELIRLSSNKFESIKGREKKNSLL
jgi:hypothetical protein